MRLIRMPELWVLLVVSLADLVNTIWAIETHAAVEANPLLAIVVSYWGSAGLAFVKMGTLVAVLLCVPIMEERLLKNERRYHVRLWRRTFTPFTIPARDAVRYRTLRVGMRYAIVLYLVTLGGTYITADSWANTASSFSGVQRQLSANNQTVDGKAPAAK